MNLPLVSWSRHPSGSRIIQDENGLWEAGEGEAARHVVGDEVEAEVSMSRMCRTWHSCSPLLRKMGELVMLEMHTA